MARVARQSRIWVEGRHDAELMRVGEGPCCCPATEGVDHLSLEVFGPTKTVRAGVLVDHLIPGSGCTLPRPSIRWEDRGIGRWAPSLTFGGFCEAAARGSGVADV